MKILFMNKSPYTPKGINGQGKVSFNKSFHRGDEYPCRFDIKRKEYVFEFDGYVYRISFSAAESGRIVIVEDEDRFAKKTYHKMTDKGVGIDVVSLKHSSGTYTHKDTPFYPCQACGKNTVNRFYCKPCHTYRGLKDVSIELGLKR